MPRTRSPYSQPKSTIQGAPNPGVNQPTEAGNYKRVSRLGGGVDAASAHGSDAQYQAPPPPQQRQSSIRKSPPPAEERVPLPNRTRRRRGVSEYAQLLSADGRRYRFRKMAPSDHGDPIAHVNATLLALLVSLAEAAKGGSANSVLKAFGVSLQDSDGQLFYDYKQADVYDVDLTPDQVLERSGFFDGGEEDDVEYEGHGMGLPGVSFSDPSQAGEE